MYFPAKNKKFLQKGFVDMLGLIAISIVMIAIPITTKLIQERQEIRKMAYVPGIGVVKSTPTPTKKPAATPTPYYVPGIGIVNQSSTPTPVKKSTPTPTKKPTPTPYYIPGIGIVNQSSTPTPVKKSTPTPKPTTKIATPTPKNTSSEPIYIPGVGVINQNPTSTPTPYYIPGIGIVNQGSTPTPTKKPTPTPYYIPGIGIVNQGSTPTPTKKPTPTPYYIPGIGIVNQGSIPTPVKKPTSSPIVNKYRCDTSNGHCIADPNGSYTTIKSCDLMCEIKAVPTPTSKPNYIYIPGVGVVNQNKPTPTPIPKPKSDYIIVGGTVIPVTPASQIGGGGGGGSPGMPVSSNPSLVRYRCGSDWKCYPDFNGQYMGAESCQSLCIKPTSISYGGSNLNYSNNSQLQGILNYNQQYGVSPDVYDIMQSSKPEWGFKQGMEEGVSTLMGIVTNPFKSFKQTFWDVPYDTSGWSQNKVLEGIDYAGDIMNDKYEDPEVQIALAAFSLGGAALYNAGLAAAPGIEEAIVRKIIQSATKTPKEIAIIQAYKNYAAQYGVQMDYTELPGTKWFSPSATSNISEETYSVKFGSAGVFSDKIKIYESAGLNEKTVFHEIAHAKGWGGQMHSLSLGADSKFMKAVSAKNECIACQVTIESLTSKGMSLNDPLIKMQIDYMKQNEERLFSALIDMSVENLDDVNKFYGLLKNNYLELAKTGVDPFVTSKMADQIVNSNFDSTFTAISEISPYFKRSLDYLEAIE